MYTIGIDLGGTNLRVGLVDEAGQIQHEINRLTEAMKGPHHVIDTMKAMIYELTDSFYPIGIGSPGPLDPKAGIIQNPPNLPGWNRIPITQILHNEFRVPVFLDNDANAAALAEAILGSGKGYDNVFYITISTGVGSGLVLHNKLIQGANGCAGEIGNMIIIPNGPTHPVLNAGSLEVLTSGTAITERGKKQLDGIKNAGDVFRFMEEGSKIAESIIKEAMNYLSIGIANIVHTLNPDVIILGGGVMEAKNIILPLLETGVKSYVYPQLRDSVKLIPATLGSKSGVIGASLLART